MTLSWTVEDVLDAVRADRIGGERHHGFSGISIDSRTVAKNELFVAIEGDTHDGHRFAADAIEKGASGLILRREKAGELPISEWRRRSVACFAVADTTDALGRLAAWHRNRCGARVIAITGTNGKTTTRALTAGVMAQTHAILATRGNFNNEIGLPLTLFRLEPRHEWAVLELGMNHPGEIRRLARICRPDSAVITNIGPAHLSGLGTVEAVMHAKTELLEEMTSEATSVLNADDAFIDAMAAKAPGPVCLFGTGERADVRARSLRITDDGCRFELMLPGETVDVRLRIPGRFMVANALAAAAVGHVAGVTGERIRQGLESVTPEKGRMILVSTPRQISFIDDTYNANPASMKAALQTLAAMSEKGRKIAVLGDMLELGEHSETLHRQVGAAAAELGIRRLYATGAFAVSVAEGAVSAGMPGAHVHCGTKDALLEALTRDLSPGDQVLVKGSRGMKMETLLGALKEWAENN